MSIEKHMQELTQALDKHATKLENISGVECKQIQQIKDIITKPHTGEELSRQIHAILFPEDSGQLNDAGSAAGGGDDAARESGAGDSGNNENNSGNSANSGESGESGGGLVRPKEEAAEMPKMNAEEFLEFATEKLGIIKANPGGLELDAKITGILQRYSRKVGHLYLSDLLPEQIAVIAEPLWLDFTACLRAENPDTSFANLLKVPELADVINPTA